MSEVVSAFIKQYYSGSTMIPKEILVESELADISLIENWLAQMKGSNVRITVPHKGDKKALLELAKRDVIEMMKTLDEKANHQREKNAAIQSALEAFIPQLSEKGKTEQYKGWRVEAYDISNTNGWIPSAQWSSLREASRREKTIEDSASKR